MNTLSTDLLEREAACDSIVSTLARAGGGQGSVLLLRGDPGIGKTRLLGWAAREAGQRFMIVHAVGHEMETAFPYAMVQQIAAAMQMGQHGPSQDLVNASATLRDLVRGLPLAGPSDVQSSLPARDEIAYAFHWLLTSVAEHRPLLLLLDDLHWSDPDSLEILRFSAWRAHTAPLAIVSGFRSWPPAVTRMADRLRDADRATVVDLEPLSTQATGALLERIVCEEIPPERTNEAYALTGGNPLLVEEVGRFWTSQDAATPLPDAADADRTSLVVSRLDGIPAKSMRLLEAASVLGDPCVVKEALAIAGIDADAIDRALAPIASLGLFSIHGPMGEFRHPLLRQMVYEAIAPERRRQLHRSAAERLRVESAPATRIAFHVAFAAQPGDAQAVLELCRAARESSAVSAHDSAAFYLRRAADLCLPGHLRAQILHELGCEQQLADAHEDACSTFARAAGEATDAMTICQISQSWAFSLTILGKSDVARQKLQTAISQQAALDPMSAVEPAIALVVLEITTRGVKEALRAGDEAVRLAEACGDPTWQGKAKAAWGWAACFAGIPGAFQLLLKIGEEIPDAADRTEALWGWSPRLVAGMTAMLSGQYAQATHFLEQRADQTRKGTARNPKIWSFALLAGCYWQMGRLRDAYRLSSEWVLSSEAFPWATSLARIFEGFTLMDIGELDAAEQALRRAQEMATRIGFQLAVATCHWANAILAARRGRIPEAAGLFLQIVPMIEHADLAEIDVFHWVREAADVFVQANESAAAQDLIDRIMQFLAASELERPGLHGVALRCIALLAAGQGDAVRAEEAFRQATALHAISNEELEHGRTLLAYGSWMRSVGRPKEARNLLRRAEAIFERCGSAYWQRRAEAEHAAANGRRRRGDYEHLSRLTPQEHRVTELVAQDCTNRQISAMLLISPKTLETHLRHIYEKLQAGSRDELKITFAAWAKGSQTAAAEGGAR